MPFPLTREWDPEIQTPKIEVATYPLSGERAIHSFLAENYGLGLKVLILIPAALHLVANHPRARWSLQLKEANSTALSAKSKEAILRPLDQTLSTTWLHLEIIFIKIMNRISEKGQPWSPMLTVHRKAKLLGRYPIFLENLPQEPRGTWMYAFSKSTKHM